VNRIKVLVADDSAVVRRLLTSVIEADTSLEVVGVAQNGRIALQKIEQLRPDVVTLDIEMPEMDGLAALKELRRTNRSLPVIMFSTLTERGAAATLDALSFGASDYVTKPANVGSVTEAMKRVEQDLIPKIKSLCHRRVPAAAAPPPPPPLRTPVVAGPTTSTIDVIAIGSSTGGPNALASVLPALPASLRVPVVITQHMPPVFTRLLAQRLDGQVALRVREAEEGAVLQPGTVLIAPGDHHMVLRRVGTSVQVHLDQGPQVNYCRPAVDVMLDSVAQVYGGSVLTVILTGMGHDGRDGCATLRRLGANVIAQDQATSVVWGMPGAVVSAGLATHVLPLDAIGPKVAELTLTRTTPLTAGARR